MFLNVDKKKRGTFVFEAQDGMEFGPDPCYIYVYTYVRSRNDLLYALLLSVSQTKVLKCPWLLL